MLIILASPPKKFFLAPLFSTTATDAWAGCSADGNSSWRKTTAPSHAEEKRQANQQKPTVPELEKHLVNQPSTEEVNSLNSKFKEATEADKKVLRTLMFPQFSHPEQQSYACMLLPDKCQIITNIPKIWRKKFWMIVSKIEYF